MREIASELKVLKLYGMAGAWGDLATSGQQPVMEESRWLIEHLLDDLANRSGLAPMELTDDALALLCAQPASAASARAASREPSQAISARFAGRVPAQPGGTTSAGRPVSMKAASVSDS